MFGRHLLTIGLLAALGCARPLPPVTATVRTPAQAPVSCSTAVHFVDGVEVGSLVRRLATALAASGTPASVLPPPVANDHLENGSLQPGSVVVQVQLSVNEGIHVVPLPKGAAAHQPWGQAKGTLSVLDGPTGSLVQTVPVEANAGNAEQALAKAEQQILSMFRTNSATLEVRMPAVDDPRVAQAVSEMRQGRWTEARSALEALSGCCAERPSAEAAYQYALGIARRFDPQTLDQPDAHFATAIEALERAVELAPHAVLYLNALSAAKGEAEDYRLLAAQRHACESRGRSLVVTSPQTEGVHPAPAAPSATQPAPTRQ